MHGAAGTAMMGRAGYCRIYFEYLILDTVVGSRGPVYEYAFPESIFHTTLSVESVGRGGTENSIPIRVEVSP